MKSQLLYTRDCTAQRNNRGCFRSVKLAGKAGPQCLTYCDTSVAAQLAGGGVVEAEYSRLEQGSTFYCI